MTFEKEFIRKSYYETIIEGEQNLHPIQVLGEKFLKEQRNEMPDLSAIRFAQGEVYFQNKDFEAAIFKWENISNELSPWAEKNIADAYYELNLFALAEEYYQAVKTDSIVLKTEVLMQLFTLYIRLGKLDQAVDSIKKAVTLNPDYPDVTTMARAFFENHQDWGNAVELAVNEVLRTESLSWVDVLKDYVEQNHTVNIKPDYFNEVLKGLFNLDQAQFVSLTAALWKSYKQGDLYFSWLKEINDFLLNLEISQPSNWSELSTLYKDTYFELIDGSLFISDFSYLVPAHLNNWMRLASGSDALIAASAVLAWRDSMSSDIDAYMVNKAGNLVSQSARYMNGMEDAMEVFDAILKWTDEKDLLVSERLKFLVHEALDPQPHRVLLAGSASSGKASLVNTLLNIELLEDYTSAVVLFKDSDEMTMEVVTNEEIRELSDLADFRVATRSQHSLINCKSPVSFLSENQLVLIDTPGLVDQRKTRNNVFQYLHLADSLLFVLNADSHLISKDLEMAHTMKEQAPKLPLHFVLWKREPFGNEEEEWQEKMALRLASTFPDAKVLAVSAYEERGSVLNKLAAFIKQIKDEERAERSPLSKLLYYIKKSIQFLLDKRVEKEIAIIDKIKWKEDLVSKLQGAYHQLRDMEEQKAQEIKQAYIKIKNELRQNVRVKIPELLQGCADQVTETSDFGNLHVEINNEMNRRVETFIEETAVRNFSEAIQVWLSEAEEAFKESQAYLDELSESFNQLFGEQKVALNCDFKVLEDWRRDIARMTRGNFQLEKVNVFLRSTPQQLLLKSAGKFFGAISKNKDMLANKYRQFIEGQDYSPIAESLTNEFMQSFELFERSLDGDLNMFFSDPFERLTQTLEDVKGEIEENNEALSQLQKSPEIYRDPLTLFELKVRQLEWMDSTGELVHEYL